jgi:hypothetical protein
MTIYKRALFCYNRLGKQPEGGSRIIMAKHTIMQKKGNSNICLAFLIFTHLVIFGCASMEAFTPSLVEIVGGQEAIDKFQYFLSTNISLTRINTANDKDTAVSRTGVVSVRSKIIKSRININKGTKGALMNYYTDMDNRLVLEVCFESDDTNRLFFAQYKPGQNNNFYILYDDAEQKLIQYGGEYYVLEYSGEEPPYLQLKIAAKDIESTKSRTVRGRKAK